jgi:hypothetical protein
MNSEQYSQFITLVEKLDQRTREGSLPWKRHMTPNAYQLPFTAYTVVLSSSEEAEFGQIYMVQIFDAGGELVEGFSDVDLDDLEDLGDENPMNYHNIMGNLYDSARRIALGSDEAIRAILAELDGRTPGKVPIQARSIRAS